LDALSNQVVLYVFNGLFNVGFALEVLLLALTRLSRYLTGVLIISPDAVFGQNTRYFGLGGLVQLLQFFLQLQLLLI
jgi:hypothetical protein